MFAATYPERVPGLILHATSGGFVPVDETEAECRARRDRLKQWLEGWGTEETTTLSMFAPTAAADPSYRAGSHDSSASRRRRQR